VMEQSIVSRLTTCTVCPSPMLPHRQAIVANLRWQIGGSFLGRRVHVGPARTTFSRKVHWCPRQSSAGIASHARGRRFESCSAHHLTSKSRTINTTPPERARWSVCFQGRAGGQRSNGAPVLWKTSCWLNFKRRPNTLRRVARILSGRSRVRLTLSVEMLRNSAGGGRFWQLWWQPKTSATWASLPEPLCRVPSR
jgi:hypothetical protein